MLQSLQELTLWVNEQLLAEVSKYTTPQSLYEPIHYALQGGGKRLRPILALLSCDMLGADYKKAIHSALSLEVFHNFTLLHDDVMDHSDLRRGRLSVPKKFGLTRAILSGDAMFALAYELLSQSPIESLAKVNTVFARMSVEIMEGQQMDMDFELREDVSLEEYTRMITKKTAVLLAASLKIGALIGGAKEELAQVFYEIGIAMGLAFQLKDDFLDVYGEEATFGKPIGGDIEENKQTWLLIQARHFAMERGEENSLKELLLIQDKEEKIKRVKEIYNRYNLPNLIEKEIENYSQKALSLLSSLDLEPTNSQKELVHLIKKMAQRIV